MRPLLYIILSLTLTYPSIPNKRIVAEWEPALGTMIRWPLGIPSSLVVELASDDVVYVLVENNSQEISARNSFIDWGINLLNIEFIYTQTYSHWTRDHGPQFMIGDGYWSVVNQIFNGYPEESGCIDECDDGMLLEDCSGFEFCNNQPGYPDEGYDCYVANELCQDSNGDGQIMDWIGDGYCDDGSWGLNFMCDDYSWDCGDCGELVSDDNGYCDSIIFATDREVVTARPVESDVRGWEEDDDTNIDFANQLGWEIHDLPLYFTGGNFMTDGYGMGFSTELMVNENNILQEQFIDIVTDNIYIDTYHIFDNPNESSIQHIDCMAKLVSAETIIIKQVSESSPEYECIEEFADSFNSLNTFYGRPFNIHRIFCPEINGGSWETNPVAAYTNSLILNNKVLVPMYGIPEDMDAIESFQEAMPGYDVIGFDDTWSNQWYGEDALHCRTMGVFDPNMMHVSHKSIRTEELNDGGIFVAAEVVSYRPNDYITDVSLNWKYSAEDGPFNIIELSCIDGNCSGVFPELTPLSDIEYYITASSSNGYSISHPSYGWHTFTSADTILGDLNYDGLVNILDVITEINAILEEEYFSSYDINGDSVLNIQDIILIINLIVG